jgi:hypothetical protein
MTLSEAGAFAQDMQATAVSFKDVAVDAKKAG